MPSSYPCFESLSYTSQCSICLSFNTQFAYVWENSGSSCLFLLQCSIMYKYREDLLVHPILSFPLNSIRKDIIKSTPWFFNSYERYHNVNYFSFNIVFLSHAILIYKYIVSNQDTVRNRMACKKKTSTVPLRDSGAIMLCLRLFIACFLLVICSCILCMLTSCPMFTHYNFLPIITKTVIVHVPHQLGFDRTFMKIKTIVQPNFIVV